MRPAALRRATDRLCVDAPRTLALTYAEVDARANQLARHLLLRGIGPGHRVALLFDDPVQAYVAMLAVLKAGAAYVPLDPGFPADRIAYIVVGRRGDGRAVAVAPARRTWRRCGREVVAVDDMAGRIGRAEPCPGDRRRARAGARRAGLHHLHLRLHGTAEGRGGRARAASCNFVRVAAEVYGYRPDDRVYQGLTIAFDFSVEEIWVPWAVGATLVPKPPGGSLLGVDLHAFLTERRVTAMCCVPTLLATLEDDLPALRFLLVSGEACPHDLDRALAPARPAVPQRLRPDRGDRQRDLGRRRPGPAGHHRRAAADLLDGDPRPRRPGPCAAARGGRRDRHRRDRAGARATSTATT